MSAFCQGQFLVALDHLRDPNFFRTVVLMLEHDSEGAMGLVVNRPSAVSIEKALSEPVPKDAPETPLYVGGPVENSSLYILHNCLVLGQHDQEILPGVFLSGSSESFETVVRDGLKPQSGIRFRVYCGYAGWAGGQLESEIGRGDWEVIPADAALVLELDPYGIWDQCMRKIHRANRILPHQVRNPEWN